MRENVCGNFYLRELFLRIAEKIVKIRTRENFVPHGRLSDRRYSSSNKYGMEEMNLLFSIETSVKLRDFLELYSLVSFQQITLTLT